jgi:hypothetical protein
VSGGDAPDPGPWPGRQAERRLPGVVDRGVVGGPRRRGPRRCTAAAPAPRRVPFLLLLCSAVSLQKPQPVCQLRTVCVLASTRKRNFFYKKKNTGCECKVSAS